jgi:hypothetical protein
VLAHEPRPGTPKQPPEHERDEDRVVELTGDRDEVRNEVEGDGEVDEREAGRDVPPPRDAPVGEEALEEDGAVGNGSGDHPDVPVAGAEGEKRYQRGIGAQENDGNEGDPAHSGPHPRWVRRFPLRFRNEKRLSLFLSARRWSTARPRCAG